MASTDSISIKELASKLKVTDALLKKIIKDFGIETLRTQKRIHLSDEAERTIREILALRASGKKNQEIKELFDASKVDHSSEKAATESNLSMVAEEQVEDIASTPEESQEKEQTESKRGFDKREKFKKNRFKDRREKTKPYKPEAQTSKSNEQVQNPPSQQREDENAIDLASYLEESEDAETSMSMRLADEDSSDEDFEDLDDEDFSDNDEFDTTEAVESTDKRISPRKVRRRQFSFRYIQRQIANDSRRIHYIKQKLKRGRLSTKEKMNLEESLEQRSKLLSGWVHLLRWVKS